MSNEPTIPLKDVIKLTEAIKQTLIANYPKQGSMFYSFGANQKAVSIIDGWVLDHGITGMAISIKTEHVPSVILAPVVLPKDETL